MRNGIEKFRVIHWLETRLSWWYWLLVQRSMMTPPSSLHPRIVPTSELHDHTSQDSKQQLASAPRTLTHSRIETIYTVNFQSISLPITRVDVPDLASRSALELESRAEQRKRAIASSSKSCTSLDNTSQQHIIDSNEDLLQLHPLFWSLHPSISTQYVLVVCSLICLSPILSRTSSIQ